MGRSVTQLIWVVALTVLANPALGTADGSDDSRGLELPLIAVEAVFMGVNLYEIARSGGDYVTGLVGVGLGGVSLVLSDRDQSVHAGALAAVGVASIALGVLSVARRLLPLGGYNRVSEKVQVLPHLGSTRTARRAAGLQLKVRF